MLGCVPVKTQHEHSSTTVLPDTEAVLVRHEAHRLIRSLLDEELIPGVSVALVDRNGPLWLEGFGLADNKKSIPATADTVYRVGSLSKPLTALAVMQLSTQSKISLDESLVRQLQGFAVRSHQLQKIEITPRQLLSHRSGLPSDLRKGMYTSTPFIQVTQLLKEHDQLIPSGGYATDLGLLMIGPDQPRLCACIIERMLDMVRFDDGSFGLTQESAADLPNAYRVLGELRFRSRRQAGKDVLLAEIDGKEMILGNRIDAHPWGQVWQQRIGNYRTLNPDGDYAIQDLQLSSQEGVLCLHYRAPHLSDSHIRVPLKPVSATEAVIEGLGRGWGETVRIVEMNGKQCLRFSGYLGEPVETD